MSRKITPKNTTVDKLELKRRPRNLTMDELKDKISTTPPEKPEQKPFRPMIVRSTPERHTPPLQEPERPRTSKMVERPLQSPKKVSELSSAKDEGDCRGATKGTDSELETAPKLHLYDEGDRRGATKGSDSELEPAPKLNHYDEGDRRGATKGSDSELEPAPKLHHYDKNDRRGATKGSDSELEPAPKLHHYALGATKGSNSELEPAPKLHHYAKYTCWCSSCKHLKNAMARNRMDRLFYWLRMNFYCFICDTDD